MLLSRTFLQRVLGALWLIDGLLQLQPQMFTVNMVNGIMAPTVAGQPTPVAAILNWIIGVTTQHLPLVNALIAIVQILLGLGLLTFSERWVRWVLAASTAWALAVWFGGEGMSMLLTGQSSVLTGAPGAALLYPLLGLVVYPRRSASDTGRVGAQKGAEGSLLSRAQLRTALVGFWAFAALLQLQPYWWQPGQISQTIGALVGQGGLNSVLVDPVLRPLTALTANIEIPLNVALILLFFGLAAALLVPALPARRQSEEYVRPALFASIVVSLLLWYGAQALGMLFTGMATDFNSGLLLVILALACLPERPRLRLLDIQAAHSVQSVGRQGEPKPGQSAQPA